MLVEVDDYMRTQGLLTREREGEMAFRTINFELAEVKVRKKKDDGSGIRVQGYSSIFDVEDSYRDTVKKGAFKKTIKQRFDKIRFLWQHRASDVMGLPTVLEEDDTGLWTEWKLLTTPEIMNEWLPRIEQGGVQGLSIGFMTVKSDWNEEDIENGDWWPRRDLLEVELIECSAVTFPANEEAVISSMKQRHEQLRTLLNEAGKKDLVLADATMLQPGMIDEAIGVLTELRNQILGKPADLPETPASPAVAPAELPDLKSVFEEFNQRLEEEAVLSELKRAADPQRS